MSGIVQDETQFSRVAGIGQDNQHIVRHQHPQIAVGRFGRMDIDSRGSGRRQRCRHLAANMARFAHAGNNDPSARRQDRFACCHKSIVERFGQFAQRFRFDADNLGSAQQDLILLSYSLNLGLR